METSVYNSIPMLVLICLNLYQSQMWWKDKIAAVVQSVQNIHHWRDWNSKCSGRSTEIVSDLYWTFHFKAKICGHLDVACPLLPFPLDSSENCTLPSLSQSSVNLFTLSCPNPVRKQLPGSVVPTHLKTNATVKHRCPHTFGRVLHMVAAAWLHGKARLTLTAWKLLSKLCGAHACIVFRCS